MCAVINILYFILILIQHSTSLVSNLLLLLLLLWSLFETDKPLLNNALVIIIRSRNTKKYKQVSNV